MGWGVNFKSIVTCLRMYEYNEHNELLFSGAVGAAQHINITTLFSGVRTVIRHAHLAAPWR